MTVLEVLLDSMNVTSGSIRVVELGLEHQLPQGIIDGSLNERTYVSESSQVTVVLENFFTNKIIKFYGEHCLFCHNPLYYCFHYVVLSSFWVPRLCNSRGHIHREKWWWDHCEVSWLRPVMDDEMYRHQMDWGHWAVHRHHKYDTWVSTRTKSVVDVTTFQSFVPIHLQSLQLLPIQLLKEIMMGILWERRGSSAKVSDWKWKVWDTLVQVYFIMVILLIIASEPVL